MWRVNNFDSFHQLKLTTSSPVSLSGSHFSDPNPISSTINSIPNGPGSGSNYKKPFAVIESTAKTMRSSIACVRCRRSKVKCVNTGPNTTCRACESSKRECSYPQPLHTGTPRPVIPAIPASTVAASNQDVLRTGVTERQETHIPPPKKSKAKKPAANSTAVATAAILNTPAMWKECLGASVLTQNVWQLLFETFQHHHSPMLPFLHPPTFLNRLRASAANPTVPSGTSPPPEKPHSPLLLLGLLALTARHIPALVSNYAPALSTPTAVSEFYASALKYRLKNDSEDSLLLPSLDKIQALLMLTIHEWGQLRKSDAYMWLGISIRMCHAMGLSWVDAEMTPCEPEVEKQNSKRRKLDFGASVKTTMANTVEKEIRRRTFWAVFIIDRAFSTGRTFPSGVPSADADKVQVPCEERGFMFGTDAKTGFLNSGALLRGINQNEQIDMGAGERIVAHVVKAMELWGQIQAGSEVTDTQPMASNSTYHKLSTALDAFIDSLPHQLEFSQDTLQVHFSTHSSSAYALLHITLFQSRITLEQQFLPQFPFRSSRPLGPEDVPQQRPTPETAQFYERSAERLYSSARDMITLISCLDEWNAVIESPFIVDAFGRASLVGLYAYNFPWMDRRGYLTGKSQIADTVPLGSGEEPRKALQFVNRLKSRWPSGGDAIILLSRTQTTLTEKKETFIHQDPHEGGQLLKRFSRMLPNVDERVRLFAMLIPPTPKMESTGTGTMLQDNGSSSEVDALLLAATSNTAPESSVTANTDGLGERWMAVNTQPTLAPAQAAQSSEDGGGSLDTLAGFAAQQGKIGNGSSSDSYDAREVEMEDSGLKDPQRWIESTGDRKGNGTIWTPLEC